MTAITENFNNPGDIIWDYFYLVNSKNQKSNILAMCPEIHIYEDIFSPSISGWALVVDTNSVISKFPIVGQEELHLSYHTPGYQDAAMTKKFRVVGVSDREVSGNKQVYKIHFITYDAYADMTMKEPRAFQGTAKQIVTNILTNLQNQADSLSPSQSEKTRLFIGTKEPQNTIKFVSPLWSPFKCINEVVTNAISGDYGMADFMFWESRRGYQLVSLTEMFKYKTIDKFKFDASRGLEDDNGVTKANFTDMMTKVLQLKIKTDTNQVNRLLNKGYGVKTVTHDLLTKNLKVEKLYTPRNTQNVVPTLNGNAPVIISDKEMTLRDNFITQVATSCSWAHNSIALDNQGPVTNTREMMLTRLGFTELDLEIWGRSWLETGLTVEFKYSSYNQNDYGSTDQDDKKMSGRYLVTAIHHILAPAQHKMAVQIVKESTSEQITAYA